VINWFIGPSHRTEEKMFGKSPLAVLLFLAISTPALSGDVYSESEAIEREKQSIDTFLKARTPKFHIVNVRDLIDADGQQKSGVKPNDWTIDFAGQHAELPSLERDSLVVIFVHGYNTPLSSALHNATALHNMLVEIDDRLRVGKPTAPRKSPMTFYAFLWRGNFGEVNFGTAQIAANTAAKSLASLIKQVADIPDHHRIVVIAHSLGSRVALEELNGSAYSGGQALS
jgi:pimeloyl-ACP methyl ester carboxylesterase